MLRMHLFPKIVDNVNRFGSMTDEEEHDILRRIDEYASPFAPANA